MANRKSFISSMMNRVFSLLNITHDGTTETYDPTGGDKTINTGNTVFIATYGTTTHAEVVAAAYAGRYVVAKQAGGSSIMFATMIIAGTSFHFRYTGSTPETWVLDPGDNWSTI